MKKTVYRTWFNDEERTINYLRIEPSGKMSQLTFYEDIYGKRVEVYCTSPINPLNSEAFIKHKETCFKSDWDHASKKAIGLITGKSERTIPFPQKRRSAP